MNVKRARLAFCAPAYAGVDQPWLEAAESLSLGWAAVPWVLLYLLVYLLLFRLAHGRGGMWWVVGALLVAVAVGL